MKLDKKLAQAVTALAYRDEWKLLMEHLTQRLERVRDGLETDTRTDDLVSKQGRALELRYLLSLESKSKAVLSAPIFPNNQ